MRLSRYIVSICVTMSLVASPQVVSAFGTTASAVTEVPAGEAKITVANNSSSQEVRVQDAEGRKLEVYNVLGMRIASYRIDSADKTVSLSLQRGCYILKVGKVVRKTFIR